MLTQLESFSSLPGRRVHAHLQWHSSLGEHLQCHSSELHLHGWKIGLFSGYIRVPERTRGCMLFKTSVVNKCFSYNRLFLSHQALLLLWSTSSFWLFTILPLLHVLAEILLGMMMEKKKLELEWRTTWQTQLSVMLEEPGFVCSFLMK